MGNIVPRTGSKSTSLAFQACVLTITPPRLPGVTILPTFTCLCGFFSDRVDTFLPTPLWNCKSVNTYNYIHTGNDLTYTYALYV